MPNRLQDGPDYTLFLYHSFIDMGQRHQAFIIARVVPYGSPPGGDRYRCVGALHHQWCYGRLPLKAATRFMTLIKQEDNATVIQEELRAIDGLYGRHHDDPPIPDIPCPFTHFLLRSTWSTELGDGAHPYTSNTLPMDAGMGSTEGGRDIYMHCSAQHNLILIDVQTTTMESPSSMLPIPKTPPTAFLLPFTLMEHLPCPQRGMFVSIIPSLHKRTSSRDSGV